MKASWPRLLAITLTALLISTASLAGELHGTVINRTTGKPVPNTDVDLLSPTQSMALLASVKSDAQGQFTASNNSIGTAPVLIRVTYQGVSFNTFSPPGRPTVDVEVFDTSKDPKSITTATRVVIFQPRGDKLIGAEEYNISNATQPPVAFFRTEGNFDFAIPENATLQQVTATSSLGMDVAQASIDKGKGLFAIAYAFRPGETRIRLSYELPYNGNAAKLKIPSVYSGTKMLLVVPPGVTLTADGANSAGQEQGMNVFTHDPLPAKAALAVSLSGVGEAPPSDGGGQNSQEGNSRNEGQQVNLAPPRIYDLIWPLVIGLGLIFAVSAILLSRKKVVVTNIPDDEEESEPEPKPKKKTKAPAPPPVAPPPPQPAASATLDSVKQQVSSSLDTLKDELFRLELRKQAGTISDSDYALEKGRIEKLLRDIVRG